MFLHRERHTHTSELHLNKPWHKGKCNPEPNSESFLQRTLGRAKHTIHIAIFHKMMNIQLESVGEHNLSHFVSPFGVTALSVSSVGTNYWVFQISCVFTEVNNSLFPQQFVSFWFYLYSNIKGPQITLIPSHLWKWGLTQLCRFCCFFSTGRRQSPKQTYIWHCKVKNKLLYPA